MKAGWKVLIVVGLVLVVMSSQVMAQPWGGGPGRGMGRGMGPGRGLGPQGAGPMGPAGPQGGTGAWGAPGAGPGAGTWCPFGLNQGAMPGLLGQRLNLTPEQREKIQDIVEEARSKVVSAIKGVLTDEQVKQFERVQERLGGRGAQMRRPGAGMPGGRMGMQGQGMRGPRMGMQAPGMGGRGMQNWGPGMGPGMQQRPAQPSPGRPGADDRRQDRDVRPAPQDGPAMLDRLFDRADANDDGALTREELKAFRSGPTDGRGPRGQ